MALLAPDALKADAFVVGLDFGTDSVRALVMDARPGGKIAGTCVVPYRRWADRLYCDPLANRFRQHPLDHIESMTQAVSGALHEAGTRVAARVAGIAAATTGSTAVLADREGTALSLLPAFQGDPDAMFIMWKDHTPVTQAEQINAAARGARVDFTKYVGTGSMATGA